MSYFLKSYFGTAIMLCSCYGNFLIPAVWEQEIGSNFCIPKSSFLVIKGTIVDYQIVTKAFHEILRLLIYRSKREKNYTHKLLQRNRKKF